MAKKMMKGNEAIAEAAIMAGCRFFFGYPITPAESDPGIHVGAHAAGGRVLFAGGERGRGH